MPLSLVLAGCATAPPQAPAPSQPQDQPRPEVPAKAPADAPHAEPEVANLTPLPSLLLIGEDAADRKSTRLNSSHANISYAVFCLKKKKNSVTQSRHRVVSGKFHMTR